MAAVPARGGDDLVATTEERLIGNHGVNELKLHVADRLFAQRALVQPTLTKIPFVKG